MFVLLRGETIVTDCAAPRHDGQDEPAPAARVLAAVLELDPADQMDALALAAAAWCYARDHPEVP